MYPIPRAKIVGPRVAGQYGEEDVSDRGFDDISLREDDFHSMNLGSEVIPGSRPAWMTMLEEPDFRKLHVDPYPKKSNQSMQSYGTKASAFSPIYDARHMFKAQPSLVSYSVDGDLKPPWETSRKQRGKNTILIILGVSALLFLVAAVTAGTLYAVVEDADSTPSANRSQGKGSFFTSTSPSIKIISTTTKPQGTPTTTTREPITTEPLTTTKSTTKSTTTTKTTTTELSKQTTDKVTTTSIVTTSSTPSTTPQPQYIFITVARGLLHRPTEITCLWTHDQDFGVIVLEVYDVDLDVGTAMVAFTDDGQHGSFYPELFTSSVRERPEGHLLISTIRNTSCADGSSNLRYRCVVRDNIHQIDASPLFVEVPADIAMTSKPTHYVIENTKTTLTCQATVESGGDVYLARRDPTGNEIERMSNLLSDAETLADGGCYSVLSRTIIVTMEMSLNGSFVRCQSEKPEGVSTEHQLLVVPESVCTGLTPKTVPHPYEASLYIECSDQEPRLTVRACSQGFIFDAEKEVCVDPHATTVTFQPSVFMEDSENVELVCSLTQGNYSNVKLLKVDTEQSREILLATFSSEGRNILELSTPRVTAAARQALSLPSMGLEFKVTLDGALCSDGGNYICRHNSGQTSIGSVNITISASLVEVTMTNDVIEGQAIEINCSGTVDDKGLVIVKHFDQSSGSFVESLTFKQTNKEVLFEDQCKSSQTIAFTAKLALSQNGTRIRCETTSPASYSNTREIFIVPVTVCAQKTSGSLVAHPYSTVKYITCGSPITIHFCDVGLIWKQDLESCIDPGAAEVTMLRSTANEGARLEVTCSLTPGSYSEIGIYRIISDIQQPIVDFLRNGTDAILSERVTSTVRRLVGSATHMVTLFDQVSCTVAGQYVCRHDNGQQSIAETDVFALPSGSSRTEVPEVQVGGSPATVYCKSIVVDKANKGRAILESATSVDGPFTNTGLEPTIALVKSEDQCETTADLNFTIPNVDFATRNGTYVRCSTDIPLMSTTPQQLILIDPSVCSGVEDGTTLQNPYVPTDYMECVENIPQLRNCPDGKLWRLDLSHCARPTDAVVSILNPSMETHLANSVNITCKVSPGTYETIKLYQDSDGSKVNLATFLSDGNSNIETQRVSNTYREKIQDGSELMTSQLTNVKCEDEGVFWCEHENTQAEQGSLVVTIPPSVTLTPDTDFAPITSNLIRCEANLDIRGPGPRITLKRRDKTSGDFVDAAVPVVETSVVEETPGCFKQERVVYSQTFDMSWNDTDFRCDVSAPESTSDIANVLVIPGDICVNEPIGGLLPHPYTTTRFIMCFQTQFAVMECPGEGYNYIPSIKECVLKGEPVAAIQAPESYTDLEDLTVTCLVTSGAFQKVKLIKVDGTDRITLAALNSDLTLATYESRDIEADASTLDSYGVRHFRVTIKAASCSDNGIYMCTLNDDQEREASVDILVPETIPSLTLQEDFISDLDANVTCESRASPSVQIDLVLQRFNPSTLQWDDTRVIPDYSRVQDPASGKSQCKVNARFEAVYDLTWNNTQVRCEVKDTALVSDAQTVYIISGDYCKDYPMASTQIHPYNQQKYLFCFGENISIFRCPDSALVWSQTRNDCVDPSDPEVAKSTTKRLSLQTTGDAKMSTIKSVLVTTAASTTINVPTTTIQAQTTSDRIPTTTSELQTTTTVKTTTVRPDPVITVTGGNFTLGSPASVSCVISYPMKGSVLMVLISDTGFDVMATFDMDTADGSKDTTTKTGLTLSRSEVGEVTSVEANFKAIGCGQAGVYVCSDDGGNTGSSKVQASVADQRLVLQTPTSMAVSEEVTFQCSSVVDKSGRLYFAIKDQDEPDTAYRELDAPELQVQKLELDACTTVVSIFLTSAFDASFQGKYIRCEATTQDQASDSYQILFS